MEAKCSPVHLPCICRILVSLRHTSKFDLCMYRSHSLQIPQNVVFCQVVPMCLSRGRLVEGVCAHSSATVEGRTRSVVDLLNVLLGVLEETQYQSIMMDLSRVFRLAEDRLAPLELRKVAACLVMPDLVSYCSLHAPLDI